MKRAIIIFSVLALLFACSKPVEYSRTLGLFSQYNDLSNEGGSTEVPVFSNTDWTVKFQQPAAWASIDRLGGHGSGYVQFDYEANFGRSRRVILEFSAADQTMTQNMFQQAKIADTDVEIEILQSSALDIPAQGADTTVAFLTNLIYNLDELYLDITYPSGQESAEPWVSMTDVNKDTLWLHFAPIDSVGTRSASIRVAHTDAGESYSSEKGTTITSNALAVTQTREAE